MKALDIHNSTERARYIMEEEKNEKYIETDLRINRVSGKKRLKDRDTHKEVQRQRGIDGATTSQVLA